MKDYAELIKRTLYLVLCFVLVLVAGLLPMEFHAVKAGRGSGTDAQLSGLEEVTTLLNGFSEQLSDRSQISSGSVSALSSKSDSGASVYTSVTVKESTSGSVNVSASVRSGSTSASSHVKSYFQREMELYITEEAVLYVSAGTIITSTAASSSSLTFDVKIYYDSEKVLLQINRFEIAQTDAEIINLSRIYGKWIELSDGKSSLSSVINSVSDVHEENVEAFELMSEYIDGGEFDKIGNVYTMTSESFGSFLTDVCEAYGVDLTYSSETCSGNFKLDLSDKTQPTISLAYAVDMTETETLSGTEAIIADALNYDYSYSCTAKMSESDTFTFSHINNTVVRLPNKLETITYDEVEEILGE